MSQVIEAPRLLAGVRSLSGVSLATRDRLLEVVARYREPESLAVTFAKAHGAGVDGVLASPSTVTCAALRELRKAVPTYAVVPTLTEHERFQLEPGIETLLSRGGTSIGLGARLRVGLASMARPGMFFRGDLAARLPLLLDAELSRLPAACVRGVVLDAWLTDLALAAGNRRGFEAFISFARRRRIAGGLETHNLGVLLARLAEWGIAPNFVIGPLNPAGLMMKPSAFEALEAVGRSEIPVVAKEIRAGGIVTLEEGARYALEHGAHGLAPDLADLDDVGSELRALAARMREPARG